MNSILVVDPSKTNLLYLTLILEKSGYRVIKASNGLDALKLFVSEQPHMVITELNLPFLSGEELVRKIRKAPQEVFSPIFVVTNSVNSEKIQKVVMAGADDFLQKPYSEQLFLAKVASLMRMRTMQEDLNDSKKTIETLHANLELEHKSAEKIFEKFVHGASKNIPGLQTHISSASIFNGDVFLSTISPSGNVVMLLGDFTGHGLPAAIGAIPSAEVFYSMNKRGRTPGEIIRVLNEKLKGILPTHIFFGCIVMTLDPEHKKLSVFNAGMQPVVRINNHDNGVQFFESSAPPLGVLDNSEFYVKFETTLVNEEDEIVLFTDGIVEAMNHKDEMFGIERLVDTLIASPQRCLDNLVKTAKVFTEGLKIEDDISVAKLKVAEVLGSSKSSLVSMANNNVLEASSWSLEFEFTHTTLQNEIDPIEGIVDTIMVMQPLVAFKEDLFIILTELFSNAVEHGLLLLDSEIKQQENGFLMFAQQKQQALKDLSDGWVKINVNQVPLGQHSGEMEFIVSQSTPNLIDYPIEDEMEFHKFFGRGLKLVKKLCHSLNLDQKNSCVHAKYHWKQKNNEL